MPSDGKRIVIRRGSISEPSLPVSFVPPPKQEHYLEVVDWEVRLARTTEVYSPYYAEAPYVYTQEDSTVRARLRCLGCGLAVGVTVPLSGVDTERGAVEAEALKFLPATCVRMEYN